MSRKAPIIKREFTQAVGSRAFLIGTILGPVLIIGIFALQFLIMMKGGGGNHHIVIVDATGRNLGASVARLTEERASAGPSFVRRPSYTLEVENAAGADRAAVGARLTERIVAEELDGYLWIPPDVITGASVQYEGSNATNSQVTNDLRSAVQRVVQSERLSSEGIDEVKLSTALSPVPMQITKTGVGNPIAARILATVMAFAIYIVVLMYGQSIMIGVQEEKRDRVVELIVSSVRARDLLIGKVLGIGGAGVLQMLIWVAVAAVFLTYGAQLATLFGASETVVAALSQQAALPKVPLSIGIAFVAFFAGGFFLFATLYALIGAIVTNTQEAQQFVMPVMLPFILGLFIAMQAAENPNSSVAVIASIVPLTSAMVMPVRASVAGINWLQLGVSVVVLYATAALIIWLAAKVYRVAIFATGKKPTMGELMRWMRAA